MQNTTDNSQAAAHSPKNEPERHPSDIWVDLGIIHCENGTPDKCLDNQQCDPVTKTCAACSKYDDIPCKCGQMAHCKTCQHSFLRQLLDIPSDLFVMQCESCLDGYFLTQKGQCLECPQTERQEQNIARLQFDTFAGCKCGAQEHCRSCSTDGAGCRNCMIGYYQQGNACVQCAEHCANCNSAAECIQCTDGYNLVAGKCEDKCEDPLCSKCANQQCVACNDHFRLKDGKCVRCPDKYCVECDQDEPGWCRQCKAGFKLENHICKQCEIDNCLYCPVKTSECKQCKLGYQLMSGKCYLGIIEHCMYYNQLICVKCQQGYRISVAASSLPQLFSPEIQKLPEVMKCLPCEQNCVECDQFGCTKCQKGYFLQFGACRPCIPGCLRCEDAVTCRTCLNGREADGTCKACPASGCACQITAIRREIRGIPDSYAVIAASTRQYVAEGCASCQYDFLPAGCASCIKGRHMSSVGECVWTKKPKEGTLTSRKLQQLKIAQIIVGVFIVNALAAIVALCVVYRNREKRMAKLIQTVRKSKRNSSASLSAISDLADDELMVFDKEYAKADAQNAAKAPQDVGKCLIPAEDVALKDAIE